tara:strand:- start:99 stop:2339 length:2241 start_codon:yes stop_codon:yes gene_type:complete
MAGNNPILKADRTTLNQYRAHMTKLGRVLSGEYEGKGRAIKKIEIGASSPCATDGETVWLTYPINPQVTDPRLNLIMTEAVLAHEAAGHLRYTNFNAWKRVTDAIKRGAEDRLMHDFTNIIEDARVNYLLGQDFGGSKKRLDFAQDFMMEQHKAMVAGRELKDEEVPRMAVLAIATEVILGVGHFFDNDKIINMMNDIRPEIKGALASVDTSEAVKGARTLLAIYRTHFPEEECDGDEYGASKTPEAEGIFADDMDMDYITEAANTQKRNKQEAEKVERKRFKKVDEVIPDSDNAGEGAGNGDGEEGEGEGDGQSAGGDGADGADGDEAGDGDGAGDGEGDGDSEGGEGDGAGNGADGDDGEEGIMGTSIVAGEAENDDAGTHGGKTQLDDNHTDGLLSGGTGSSEAMFGTDFAENLLAEAGDMLDDFEDMKFDEDGEEIVNEFAYADTYGLTDDSGHAIITQVNEQWRRGNMVSIEKYKQIASANRAGIKRLGRQIERIIKGADSRFSTHHKKGKLDDNRLWAVRSSERLFQKPKTHEAFNLRCVVLIDASGSMGGNRSVMAAQAAVTLCEALEQVKADYEVVDFNSSNGGVEGYPNGATYINVRKGAQTALTTQVKRQVATPFAGSQNSDGYAVKWAARRTKQFGKDGAKRLVFIISDGAPAGPAPEGMGAGDHLKMVLRDLEDDDVLLFSVGICGMNTSRWYGNHGHASVGDVNTLASDIITPFKVAMKRLMKSGKKRRVVSE